MDALAGLEPQLAIPVILVVVGAVLVYMFGFQQTEEPSSEHLAVLQSSSSYKNRSVPTNAPKQNRASAPSTPATNKPKANGHLPSANGGVKKAAKVEVSKENKAPQAKGQARKENAKDASAKPEDFESGEWIPAVTRKEKNKKKEVSSPVIPTSSPGKRERREREDKVITGTVVETRASATTTTPTLPSTQSSPGKARPIEEVMAELLQAQKQESSPVKTSPEKKGQDTPKKETKEKKIEPAQTIAPVAASPAPASAQEAKAEEPKTFKANIAFDEMGGTGDAWEEAKSRGAKKRTRTRKD